MPPSPTLEEKAWLFTLQFDLLTWISIGIIYLSRTIYLPSFEGVPVNCETEKNEKKRKEKKKRKENKEKSNKKKRKKTKRKKTKTK